jgi:hypothetical protein
MSQGKLLVCLSISLMTFLAPMSSYAASVTDIIGGWRLLTEPGTNAVFTFTSDGRYFVAEDVPPGTPGVQNGMELGTYAWNPVTGIFQYSTLVDTNGEGGLTGTPAGMTLAINGNTMTSSNGGVLSRLISATNPLVGSWSLDDSILSFAPDGAYFLSTGETPSGAGQRGMERGTYAWDPVTGAISYTTLVNTDGDFGFSNDRVARFVVDGNVLRGFDVDGEQYQLDRVVAIPLPPGIVLMLGGVGMLGALARRSRKA